MWNMKNQHFFFSWSCCYLGGVCPNDTFLFVHQSACFMNVLQWTVFVPFTWRKEKKQSRKKKTAQGYRKPSNGLVQLNLVCNQFDVALTSMYTKVLTEWDGTKRSTKWQRNMSQYSLLPVIIYLSPPHPPQWKPPQCFLVRSPRTLLFCCCVAPDVILMTGPRVSST